MTKDELNKRMDDSFNGMYKVVDGIDIDSIRTEGMTVRIGGKLFDLSLSKIQDNDIEKAIRDELSKKVSDQMKQVKEILKQKRLESSMMVNSFMEEYERKEKSLKDLLDKSAPMPDVTWAHAEKGLSLVKGDKRNELVWLAKRVYNPKFVDRCPIEPLYVKKLMTNIYIVVRTVDNVVARVSTHYMNNLRYFAHYHQTSPDCWGSWNWQRKWETPEDIIKIADEAEAVLENINTMSIANRRPALLPRLDTLRRHVSNTPANIDVKLSATSIREGMNGIDQDIWGN